MIKQLIGTTLMLSTSFIAVAEQYNLSLSYDPITTSAGIVTTLPAANVDKAWHVEAKTVTEIATGIYRIGGWGIGNIIAVQGDQGWIIIDTGDSVDAATKQRSALEAKLGHEISVGAILYTHSHYSGGASVWQDEKTQIYGHEWLEKHLLADEGVSPLMGNFATRAMIQFGMLHPQQGPDAFPNKLGFSIDKMSQTSGYVSPDVTFENGQVESHQIAGLEVVVLPSPTDVTDSVAFYFPQKSLMVTNAINGEQTIFNLYTLRGDSYRDPIRLVAAADLILSYDFNYHLDIHGPANVTTVEARQSILAFRDSMQLIHDQTIRAISKGKDAQGAAEFVYMPANLREGKETYGQVESHVKQVYNGTVGWNGWDVYNINPLRSKEFSQLFIDGIGGLEQGIQMATAANQKGSITGWHWSLYLTSKLLELEPENAQIKQIRAGSARALGQRTSSANARGFYISEALLHEGQLSFNGEVLNDFTTLSESLGKLNRDKLAQSPITNNVEYLRYLVDPRTAEGLTAEFRLKITDTNETFGVTLRNAIIQVTKQPTQNASPNSINLALSHDSWSDILLGLVKFAELDKNLGAFDQALTITANPSNGKEL